MTFETELAKIEAWLGVPTPTAYRKALKTHGGKIFRDLVVIYEASSVVERNETYQTKEYCPGFIAVGDDSGGRAIVISVAKTECRVFVSGQGYMDPEGFEVVGDNLLQWIDEGCPLPE